VVLRIRICIRKDPYNFAKRIRVKVIKGSRQIRICIKVKIQELWPQLVEDHFEPMDGREGLL
jgi:hypothetical protein